MDVVGPALLQGLHDGGRVGGAEAALEEVVGHAGADGVWWLARGRDAYRIEVSVCGFFLAKHVRKGNSALPSV